MCAIKLKKKDKYFKASLNKKHNLNFRRKDAQK